MPDINYFAVLVSGIAAMVIGYIWYGPLFGKVWVAGMGLGMSDPKKMEEAKKGMGLAYFQQFIGALITAFCLAHVLWAYHIAMPDTAAVSAGLQGGFWVWFGFILPTKYADKLWGGKKSKTLAIELGASLITLLVMGAILSSWK